MPLVDCPIPEKEWTEEVSQRDGASAGEAHHLREQTVPDAGSWEPAVQKIVGFQHLGDDWDGLGAKAPTHDLLASAIGLAYLLLEKGLNPPHAVTAGINGTVLLEWQDADGTYTEVEIVRPMHAEVMVLERGKPAQHWTLPTE
jgi:hypothetical protein